jgi:hypothetical protein
MDGVGVAIWDRFGMRGENGKTARDVRSRRVLFPACFCVYAMNGDAVEEDGRDSCFARTGKPGRHGMCAHAGFWFSRVFAFVR